MTPEQIADIIQGNPQSSHQSTLIAIEGFGGSGKTTLANTLANELGKAYVIHMDDFIVKEKLTEPSWDKGSFDRERLERQVLRPLRDGRAASYQKLIWQNNSLSDYVTVPSAEYIIIEGISSYHPLIAHYYDWKIWVDTPIEVAKERGRARDGSNENAPLWDLWAKNDLRYQEKYHPETVADFVLNNEASI